MAFKTLFNVMPDDSASWGAFFQRQDCPRPLAQRLATRDPDIKSFFICRRDLKCQKGTFPAGTTVFVMTSPGTSANSACDSYQKDFFNVGYVNPDNMPLRYAGQVCVRSNTDRRPFFDIVCLFAVGIQGARDAARLEIGRGVAHTLDHTDDVAALQSLGIAVLLSVVGDWGPAGWSNFPTKESAYAFANKLGEVVARYGLDGIDIDDEYSDKRLVEGDSIIMVTSRLREQAKEKIIISKALYDDQLDFKWRWNGKTLAQQLSHGWDMSYGDDTGIARLRPYAELPPDADMRMQKHQLALGVRNCPEDPRNWTPPDFVARQTQEVKDNAYGGMMVFAAEDFVRAPDYEFRISGVFYQGDVGNSTPGCRYLPTSILALAHSADEGNLHRLYISLASGGRVFGPPTPVKASGNDYHETTDVGTAMAVFKDLLWLAWIGPTAGGRDNYRNVCSAKSIQRPNGSLQQEGHVSGSAKSVHAPAMAVFEERLYLAWTDLEGALQLMSCDGQSWTKPQVIKDKGVKGAPALGVVGDWLCAMVADDDANTSSAGARRTG